LGRFRVRIGFENGAVEGAYPNAVAVKRVPKGHGKQSHKREQSGTITAVVKGMDDCKECKQPLIEVDNRARAFAGA
jgi:hypothetical protein